MGRPDATHVDAYDAEPLLGVPGSLRSVDDMRSVVDA
jgi:hypothetical protein